MSQDGTMNEVHKGCVGFNILVIFKCLNGTVHVLMLLL